MRSFLLSLVLLCMPTVAMEAPEKAISKKDYEKAINKRNQGPVYTKRLMDAETMSFLDVVKKKWVIRTSECPYKAFSEIAEVAGVRESVEGVVNLFTHKSPDFSEDDDHRNLVEAEIAAVMSISLPVTMDNLIHANPGVAYVVHSKSAVTVYEDTAMGLKCTIYMNPDDK